MYTSACFNFCTCSTNTFFITSCVSFFLSYFDVLFFNLLHSHILIQFFTIPAFLSTKLITITYSWLLQYNPQPFPTWPFLLFSFCGSGIGGCQKKIATNFSCIKCVPYHCRSVLLVSFPFFLFVSFCLLVTVLLYLLLDWIDLHHLLKHYTFIRYHSLVSNLSALSKIDK